MEGVLKFVILSLVLVGSISCAEIPVGKCKLEDSACMLPAFQKVLPMFMAGVPDWGVEVLDPLQLDDLAFELSGLKSTMKEGRVTGMKGANFKKVKWDTKKQRLSLDYNVDVSLTGHYTAAGQVLILPITGDGEMDFKLKNLHISETIDFTMVTGDDGKKHVKLSKYDFKFEVIDNVHFDLTGLFNGNKELSDTMLTFLNDNWKEVMEGFGRPVIDAAIKKMYENIAKFLDKNAIEDIAEV